MGHNSRLPRLVRQHRQPRDIYVEQCEPEVPHDRLKNAGATVEIVSLAAGEIEGWDRKDWCRTAALPEVGSGVRQQQPRATSSSLVSHLGGSRPGLVSQSFRRAVVSASRALRNSSRRAGPAGRASASARALAADSSNRSVVLVTFLRRLRFGGEVAGCMVISSCSGTMQPVAGFCLII